MTRRTNESGGDDEESGSGLSLALMLSAVRSRWPLVAMTVVAASVLAGVVAYGLPNRYEASAVIQIDPRRKIVSNIDPVVADMKADATTIESEVEILRSRAIALRAIEVLGLREAGLGAADTWWRKLGGSLGLVQAPATERIGPRAPLSIDDLVADAPGSYKPEADPLAAAFADMIKVQRIRTTLLIEVKALSGDPMQAARIANVVADVYLEGQLEAKSKASTMATDMLEEKIDGLRKRVAEAERKVEQYKARHSIFDSEGQALSEKQLARVMEQHVAARNATAEARAKYELAQKLMRAGDGGATLADVLQSHTVRQMKEQAAAVSRREAELLTKYGAKHPEILKVRAELQDAQSHLKVEIERLVENLRNEMEVAVEKERQVAATLARTKEQQVVDKEAGVELKELEREAVTSKQLFEALLARYKQTAETQGLQLPDARIVERADVPLFPAFPKRKPMLAIGVVGGLALGLALALAFELMATGIGRPEDIERVLELAHLSSLPRIAERGVTAVDPMRSVRLIIAEPHGLFAEAIRAARREIDIKRAGRAGRIVLVASSLPNEGSGIVASNLAHHYGLTGQRVLLIDGDLRRSGLTRQLAPQRPSGLLEALTGGVPVEQAVLRDATTGLHFLPASGPAPSSASAPELLSSRALADALGRLKRQFDTIIVDAPPLLPVIDGRVLADYADQVVMVMVWRQTPKQLAKKALAALGPNQRKIAGVIVNEVDPAVIADDRGGGYGAIGRLEAA